jgi:hypothetical protein
MIGTYNLYPFLTEDTYHFYYKGVALAWVLPAVAFIKLTYHSRIRPASIAFIGFTLNNLVDEFCCDPQRLQLNELLFAIAIIFWIIKDPYK